MTVSWPAALLFVGVTWAGVAAVAVWLLAWRDVSVAEITAAAPPCCCHDDGGGGGGDPGPDLDPVDVAEQWAIVEGMPK